MASASYTITKVNDGLTTFYQYAQNFSATTAPSSGWSTSVPSSEPGKYIWRREGLALVIADVVWGVPICLTGSSGPAGEAGTPARDFEITATPSIYELSARGVILKDQSVLLSCRLLNIPSGTTISWELLDANYDLGAITGENTSIIITEGYAPPLITVQCSVTGYGSKTLTITAVRLGMPIPRYLGVLEEAPLLVDGQEPLIDGDYYLDMDNIPRIYRGSSWYPVSNIDGGYSIMVANCLADALASGRTVGSMSVLYGYFQNLVARNLVVSDEDQDFIFSVNPEGHTTSDGYKRPSFEISVHDPTPDKPFNRRTLLGINAEDKKLNIDTDGLFSGEINSPALTTTKGSVAKNKTFTASVTTVYPVATLYNSVSLVTDGAIQTISDSYYEKSIAKAGRLSASGSMLTLGSWSVDKFKQGSGWVNYANTTVPAGCNFINVTLTIYNDWGVGTPGGANIEIWRGSTRIVNQTYRGSFSSTKSASYTYDVQPGDAIKAFVEGYPITGSSHAYVDITYRAKATEKSLFFIYTDGSSKFVPYSYYTNIDAKVNGYSTTKNLFIASELRKLLVSDFPTNVWIPCLSGSQYSIKALESSLSSKSVISMRITTDSVQFMESTGDVFTMAVWGGLGSSLTGLYESLSATLVTEATPRRIDVSSLTPKDGASVGTEGEPFNLGHFKILAAQTDVTVKGKSVLATEVANGYPGMLPDGGNSNYIRTGKNGLIPYESGGSGYVGTASWPFSYGYFNNLYIRGKEITRTTHKYQPVVNGTVIIDAMDVGEMRICTFGPLGTSSGNNIEDIKLPSGGTYRVEGRYYNYNGFIPVGIATTGENQSYASGNSFALFSGGAMIATDNGSSRTDVYDAYFIIWRMM